jgi:cell division protein ZapE
MIQTKEPFHRCFQNLLQKNYRQRVVQQSIVSDQAQITIIDHLQTLLEQLVDLEHYENQALYQRLLMQPPKPARNIYLYGDVGRGKSMLMDLFFEACPIKQKRRVHFLTFMQEVHQFVHQRRLENKYDTIPALAKKIRASSRVLCFDEFHVHDIADAMIMSRLFTQLFNLGLVIVATSNSQPNDLYRDGLQRDSFLPFIKLLQETSIVVALTAEKDYRCSNQEHIQQNYYWPLDQNANTFLLKQFDNLTNKATKETKTLSILGRDLVLTVANNTMAYTSFHYLCGQALGPADYLAIAQQFEYIFIANIPELSNRHINEAKRFVTLIDALYEHKVKLICTAEASVDKLYIKGKNAFEFKRTSSRLAEMQTLIYWQTKHTP